ncbi:MAG TPA: hypothetical protein VHS99_18890, partial [Chloroflexota bacterium]|nr:hypothetical protein [Chloroflexota bacterium]
MGDDAGGADPVTAYLGRPAGRIMLLGTFHIHNPGHDAYKPRFTLDVFTARRQREIADVVEGNRNLRIVANLQRITEQPEEKI